MESNRPRGAAWDRPSAYRGPTSLSPAYLKAPDRLAVWEAGNETGGELGVERGGGELGMLVDDRDR